MHYNFLSRQDIEAVQYDDAHVHGVVVSGKSITRHKSLIQPPTESRCSRPPLWDGSTRCLSSQLHKSHKAQ